MDLSNNQTTEPDISKLELNHIPDVPKPPAEEPAKESASNMKPQEQEDNKNTTEIKPETTQTILKPQEDMKHMEPDVDNVIQNMKDELKPQNSIKQVEKAGSEPEEKPALLTSPVKEEGEKGEAEKPPENVSPAKPRFQKKVSGSGSAVDTNSVDLNLSISSFINKSKESGSISVQVRPLTEYKEMLIHLYIDACNSNLHYI